MLQPEIRPFATANIEKIEKIRTRLAVEFDQITEEEIYLICAELTTVKNALFRFQVCMEDEVKQKNQLRSLAIQHRLIP